MPTVKNVGEPCAGEPHARFEVAAGGIWHQSATAARRWRLPPTLHAPDSSQRLSASRSAGARVARGRGSGRPPGCAAGSGMRTSSRSFGMPQRWASRRFALPATGCIGILAPDYGPRADFTTTQRRAPSHVVRAGNHELARGTCARPDGRAPPRALRPIPNGTATPGPAQRRGATTRGRRANGVRPARPTCEVTDGRLRATAPLRRPSRSRPAGHSARRSP
jgi:hypothetical protein